ncbi:molybdenum ABC transporter ATP-binding protein [Vineibacter terrae]|uniref:Molybdenum ABC transporter ATP-binding protein n=1 Tax=Vineibacter terrae TaxID=2586908 RepID=A0A5C8PHZ1_9HYPH|nr:molybdenum ABC transporter ATP-binding protein [Vineibacter terrae]TXL73309.1 molybdenum ABC transporter ATP-binding protein [Vineibacter terrae]
MMLTVDLRHRLGAFTLDVRFQSEGRLTALFGRSGSGKTSIVNLVAGLTRPDEGVIAVDGATLVDTRNRIFVPKHRRRVGYVFQEGRLFPHLSVRRNLLYGRWFSSVREKRIAVDQVVELLGLGHLLARGPASLSGGEKQRVAIGRALLSDPRLLLMDEPLASLDELRKAEILPYIERLRDEMGIPVLYVSHAIAEVTRLATTVVLLSEGRVLAVGAPADVLSGSEMVPIVGAGEAGTLLEARVAALDATFGLSTLQTQAGKLIVPRVAAGIGSTMRVFIRASDVMLSQSRPDGISALNVLAGRIVDLAEESRTVVDATLDCGGQRLLARITRKSAIALKLAPDTPIFAIIKSVALEQGERR